jgi:hypothetical protein
MSEVGNKIDKIFRFYLVAYGLFLILFVGFTALTMDFSFMIVPPELRRRVGVMGLLFILSGLFTILTGFALVENKSLLCTVSALLSISSVVPCLSINQSLREFASNIGFTDGFLILIIVWTVLSLMYPTLKSSFQLVRHKIHAVTVTHSIIITVIALVMLGIGILMWTWGVTYLYWEGKTHVLCYPYRSSSLVLVIISAILFVVSLLGYRQKR